MGLLDKIKAWAADGKEEQPPQVWYHPLHVVYIAKDEKGNTVTGETLICLEHGENIHYLRERVRSLLKEKAPDMKFELPVLTNITELSVGLYKSLMSEENKGATA